jgi:hypothetical protein
LSLTGKFIQATHDMTLDSCAQSIAYRFAFEDAVKAFETTKTGKGPDGKGVIKAIISAPKEEESQARL